jgi:hypothetical protein
MIGKVADDNTSRTINAYLAGAYGDPSSKQAVDMAIRNLMTNKLNNQVVFKTKKSLTKIRFMRSETIWL